MYYMFMKMSGKWYYQEFSSFHNRELLDNATAHVEDGTIVAFADDLEGFADEMGIKVDELHFVEPE